MQPENYRLKNAEYIDGYELSVEFQDGTKGRLNLERELKIGRLKDLQNKDLFMQFEIHPIFKTLCWPNGADFAPEFLRENLR